jgi:hypothetical protein
MTSAEPVDNDITRTRAGQLRNESAREIFRSYFDLSPKDREHVTWIMSRAWMNDLVRWQLGFEVPGPPQLYMLLGRPVEVRDNAGFPEPEVRP